MANKENLNEENLNTGAEGAEGTEQKVDLESAIRAAFDAAHAAGKAPGPGHACAHNAQHRQRKEHRVLPAGRCQKCAPA